MMLDRFGTEAEVKAANQIRSAVHVVFSDPRLRTADMGGTLTTEEMGRELVRALGAPL